MLLFSAAYLLWCIIILMSEASDNTPSDPIGPRDPTTFPSLEPVTSSLQSSAENHLKVLSAYVSLQYRLPLDLSLE